MITYRVAVVFDGLDLDDDDVVDSLFEALPDAAPAQVNGVTTVTMELDAPDAEQAVLDLVSRVTDAVPRAQPMRVDQDLVGINDIAERVGRSREFVRLLADGKRGPGAFPDHIGVVGNGIRVWPWAVVLDWFRSTMGLNSNETGILPEAAAVMDACFAARRLLPTTLNQSWPSPETRTKVTKWQVRRHGVLVAV